MTENGNHKSDRENIKFYIVLPLAYILYSQ